MELDVGIQGEGQQQQQQQDDGLRVTAALARQGEAAARVPAQRREQGGQAEGPGAQGQQEEQQHEDGQGGQGEHGEQGGQGEQEEQGGPGDQGGQGGQVDQGEQGEQGGRGGVPRSPGAPPSTGAALRPGALAPSPRSLPSLRAWALRGLDVPGAHQPAAGEQGADGRREQGLQGQARREEQHAAPAAAPPAPDSPTCPPHRLARVTTRAHAASRATPAGAAPADPSHGHTLSETPQSAPHPPSAPRRSPSPPSPPGRTPSSIPPRPTHASPLTAPSPPPLSPGSSAVASPTAASAASSPAGSPPASAAPRPPSAAAAAARWHRAVAALAEVQQLHRMASTLSNRDAVPADRLYAAVGLAVQRAAWEGLLPASPHRQLLRHYIAKKRAGRLKSVWERLEAEFVITGTLVFDWCTPARLGEHWPIFTVAFTASCLVAFFFAAAQYPYWAAVRAAGACGRQAQRLAGAEALQEVAQRCWQGALLTPRTGPSFLGEVLLRGGSTPATSLPFAFLRQWGGRYPPDLQRGQAYRWLSCQLLHTDFPHLAANLLLFVALGGLLEQRYGSLRVAGVWLAAVVGGGLLSVAVEDPCGQVVGCSGGDFGLLGLFLADTLLGWRGLARPVLRCGAIAVLLGFLVYTLAAQQAHISHMSHVGGLLCGLLPGLLVLPRLASERWEAAWPALGGAGVLVWYGVLPAWVYAVRLPYAAAACSSAATTTS